MSFCKKGGSVEVTASLKKKVTGLDFTMVVKLLGGGMHNISSHELREGGELEEFLGKSGLEIQHVVFMAPHSIGERDWRVVDDREPAFYEDPLFYGGWYVFTDKDVTFLYCESATSGSSLRAEKQEDETWTVTLEVPVNEDGNPYQGNYWDTFHEALGLTEKVPA